MKRMPLFVLVACLIGALASAQDNLVKNPGFEEVTEDGKALDAWGLPTLKGVKFSWDDGAAHTGKRSGRIDGVDAEKQSHYVQAWRQEIGSLSDGKLWLSVWVKGQDVTAVSVGVLHRDKGKQVLKNQIIGTASGTFDWQEIAGPLDRPEGTTDLQLVIGIKKSTGTAWFDDVSVAPPPDVAADYGTVTMTPTDEQLAGSTVPVRFDVTLGTRGMTPGGSLTVRWEKWRPAREFRVSEIRVVCDQPGARFKVEIPPREKKGSWPPINQPVAFTATMTDGDPLPPGAKVTLSMEMTYTHYSNVLSPLAVLLAPSAGSTAVSLGEPFVLKAKGGPAAEVHCIAAARPVAGKPGRVIVAVTDAHGNPSEDFRGSVQLTCNTQTDLPAEYQFTEVDAGSHCFEACFPAGTVSRVTVGSGEMTAASNPILPRKEDEPGIYLGDIHSHCEVSADAVGDPDLAYDYARKFHGLDFAALSDHGPRGEKWDQIVEVGNRHNVPGRFVTFLAVETGHRDLGHRNIYYRGDSAPGTPHGVKGDLQSMWQFLDKEGARALVIPHHPNTDSHVKLADGKLVWGPTDWTEINHIYQRIVEICQNRNSFEVPGPNKELRVTAKDCGASVQTALAKGHRLGFIGSTDTHSGRPGTGVARCAIISRNFSRQGLWDAMHDRRCYATTGKHILLFFTLNGRPMGSEITLPNPSAKREVRWRVIGTGPIKRVDLLRNNEVIKSWDGGGADDLSDEFAVDTPIQRTEWYYLRAIQEDTEMAWASPIWVDPPKQP